MKAPREASTLSPLQLKAESDPQFAETMWRLRNPEEGGQKHTLEQILAEDLPLLGVPCKSLDTLSRFYAWLKLGRQFQEDREFVNQFKEELRKDPNIPEDEIERRGRILFMTRSVAKDDPKVFATMHRLGTDTKSTQQRDKQLKQRDKELTQREKLVEQSERRIAMLEKKAAFYDAVKKAAENREGGITAEEMADIERRLKLM